MYLVVSWLWTIERIRQCALDVHIVLKIVPITFGIQIWRKYVKLQQVQTVSSTKCQNYQEIFPVLLETKEDTFIGIENLKNCDICDLWHITKYILLYFLVPLLGLMLIGYRQQQIISISFPPLLNIFLPILEWCPNFSRADGQLH